MEYSKEQSKESSMEYLNHAKHTVKKYFMVLLHVHGNQFILKACLNVRKCKRMS